MQRLSGRPFAGAVLTSLRLAAHAFINNPVTLLVSLAAILVTSFLKCVTWGCDLRMGSGWRFFLEFIAPGLVLVFLITFLWQLRRNLSRPFD
jgi:hypothetical protein